MYHFVRLFCVFALVLIGCDSRPVPSSSDSTSPPASSRPASTRAGQDGISPEQQFVGTWVANDVDAKMGQVKIKLIFADAGGVKLAAWSDIPFAGQVRDKKGAYEVHGNVVSSEAIRGGTSVEFHFDSGGLLIQYKDGKTIRFHRG